MAEGLIGYDNELLLTRSERKHAKRQKDKRERQEAVANTTETKYYDQRYSLFSLFDRGIQLDDESWFSVTPEQIAKHHANRCVGHVILDVCCGVGGNTIAFSSTCKRVVAVDIDPMKIAMGKHNAAIYGCENIDWVLGDFVTLSASGVLDKYGVSGVFISPPWGGPGYARKEKFSLRDLGINIEEFIRAALRLSKNVALFLPRNLDCQELRSLVPGSAYCEVESNYLNDRFKAVTVYFGDAWVGSGGTN